MPRVNIEDRVFADKKLAIIGKQMKKHKFDLAEEARAIGMLALLWRNSQEAQKITATKEEIAEWWGEIEVTTSVDFLISAFVSANFLEKIDENYFAIAGNEKQLAQQAKWRQNSRMGGEATKKRNEELAACKNQAADDGTPEASQVAGHVAMVKVDPPGQQQAGQVARHIQFNSIQCNSTQLNSEINKVDDHSHEPQTSLQDRFSDGQSPPVPVEIVEAKPKAMKKPEGPSPGTLVWEAYAKAYAMRLGVDPVRNAKQNALCSQLVKRLGVAEAQAVAVFYLSHPDGFYMRSKYALGLLVKDCEGIRTEMMRGQYVTAEAAKRASIQQQNNSAFDKFKD